MFEGPISNNKEEINIDPSPPARPWQKIIFKKIYLIDMKIVIFMFESPISNNKEYKNVAPSPCFDAPGQKIFL